MFAMVNQKKRKSKKIETRKEKSAKKKSSIAISKDRCVWVEIAQQVSGRQN